MKKRGIFFFLAAMLVAASSAPSREKSAESQFKYAGGTEKLPEACEGKLEVTEAMLIFKCPAGFINIPYYSIRLMQYRPDVSGKVWKMKLKWKVRPSAVSPMMGGKRNRYFTVLYDERGEARAMVLDVPPGTMRPYLAEIDLKSGKRVEVKAFEEYD